MISVDYRDNTNKFWNDSAIKKHLVTYDETKQTIHEVVKQLCAEADGMELSYKGKPQGNVHRDIKTNGEITGSEIVGYLYRGKTDIHDRDMPKSVKVNFDVWVSIWEIGKFEFESIDL